MLTGPFCPDDRQVRHKAEQASAVLGRAKDSVGDFVDYTKDSLSDAAGSLSARASELGEAAREKTHDFKAAAGERLEGYGDSIQEQSQKAVDEFQHILHTSPLAVAGVAAAVGLAFGLLLPDTEVENRAMGEARDHWVGQSSGEHDRGG